MNKNIFEDYKKFAGPEAIDQLFQVANQLQKISIVHVSSTATGGGVAEILIRMIPMTQALGIDTRWEILEGSQEFFQCTKIFHNALQGLNEFPSTLQIQQYEEINKQNAERLKDILTHADIVIIHDPQPLPLIAFTPQRKGKWIWRCHIDTSSPNEDVWKYLKQYINQFDASIFSLAEFTHPSPHPVFTIPPSIDPLTDKNCELEKKEIDNVYDLFKIDPTHPIILQVSRYDRFKDPLGVIKAYRLIQKINSTVQLVLVGGGASDDPEGDLVLNEVRNAADGDPNIFVLLLSNDAHRTINALQRAATIVLQKSLREGFGLTVTEALWKRKPVIGGNTGGIKLQLINGQTGFVVNTPEEAASRISHLLQHPEECQLLGSNGREHVREKFLITRHLRDYLSLILSLISENSNKMK
ncbi:MAG: glycosyltransferase [Parachlamydiaceae bacterium]|nr:glycosyltransferase [Parachlamydiaceae bacterium]